MAERVIDNIDKLSGPEKAAALLLSLPPEFVSKVLEKLDQTEIHELSQTMATLGRVKAEAVEGLFKEFTDSLSSTGSLNGTYDSTERFLSKVLEGEKVKSIMEEIRGPAGRTVWDKLCNVSEDTLASFLMHEHPQTVAVIMSKIRSDHASKVFSKLPEDFAQIVVERMLRMDVIKREVLDNIEKTLRSEFMNTLAKTSQRDSHEIMADIFNSFDRATEAKFLSYLETHLPEAAERIKSLMFTFDDLAKLDAAGVQALIRVADKSKLALSLKGAAEAIKTLVFTNMSERAAKLLKEDIEALGMVRLRDVEEAQLEIINTTKSLIDKGEITIREGNEEEEMVA